MGVKQVYKFTLNGEDKAVLSEAVKLLNKLNQDAEGMIIEGQVELKQAMCCLDLLLPKIGEDNTLIPENNLADIIDIQSAYDDGYDKGYDSGKSEGYSEGYDDGYAAGYTQGTEENGGDE